MTTQNETEVVEGLADALCGYSHCEKCDIHGKRACDKAARAAIKYLTSLGFSRRADVVEECAKVADLYAETNAEQMGDSVLLDPLLHGKPWTAENMAKSNGMIIDGCVHSSMYHAATNIAEAIRAKIGGKK